MCFGAGAGIGSALIGSLLSAGGSVLSMQQAASQQRAIVDARNKVLNQTLQKNDKIADTARSYFDQRRDQMQPEQAQATQDKATADRTATLDEAVSSQPTNDVPLGGSTPQVVKTEVARKMADAVKYGKSQAQALGKVGGFGDAWFQQGVDNADAGRNIGVQQNLGQGNLAILPYKQDLAELAAYKPASPFGSILTGIGGMMGSYGGGGMPKKPMYQSPLTPAGGLY